jgi:SagB-type dehydrogenase family enzyme
MKAKKNLSKEKASIIEQSTYQNGYGILTKRATSIGFKVNTLKTTQCNSITKLSNDFIVNLGMQRNDNESQHSILSYLMPNGSMMLSQTNQEDNDDFEKHTLPTSISLKMSLENTLKQRRSKRHFTGDKAPLNYLATILRAAYGITGSTEANHTRSEPINLNLRTTPSAGGIYPIDLYIAALNIDGIKQSIYQYNPTEDKLIKLYTEAHVEKLLNAFATNEEQINLRRSAFICLMIGSPEKSMRKYGNLGLSFTLHEVGSISQNIHLATTALGLGSVDCASYYRDEAHKVLNIDGLYMNLLHTIIIGVS